MLINAHTMMLCALIDTQEWDANESSFQESHAPHCHRTRDMEFRTKLNAVQFASIEHLTADLGYITETTNKINIAHLLRDIADGTAFETADVAEHMAAAHMLGETERQQRTQVEKLTEALTKALDDNKELQQHLAKAQARGTTFSSCKVDHAVQQDHGVSGEGPANS
eukprot:jgi/Mesvir1/18691/Mv17180-RA.1